MAFLGQPPPLTPVLLAGLALRLLPPVVFQPVLTLTAGAMHRRHPEAFARLEPLADALFLIDPLDLPFNFLLRPGTRPPNLTIVRDDQPARDATATVRGPLFSLIALLEGRADGDALFFSRDLIIEGDTEAILTLRNAIDGAGIDVVEVVAAPFGPLSGVVRKLAGPIDTLFGQIARDLETLRSALIAPATGRCDAQTAELNELRGKLAELDRRTCAGRAKKAAAR
jgi:predicted lipid carrier protein YhbT